MAGSENSFWTAPLTQHPSLVSRRRGCDMLNLAGADFLTRTAGFRACRQFADQLVRGMSALGQTGRVSDLVKVRYVLSAEGLSADIWGLREIQFAKGC
jgi:hypothetical protein